MTAIVDELADLFARAGAQAYLGEPVSMAEHMLQTADAAEHDGAPADLVVAALLHDVGHLVHTMAPDSAEHGIDTAHEEVGRALVVGGVPGDRRRADPPSCRPPSATSAQRLRATCTVLSPASVHSLMLQGGPMTSEEVVEVRVAPPLGRRRATSTMGRFRQGAGRAVPHFEHYRPFLEQCNIVRIGPITDT